MSTFVNGRNPIQGLPSSDDVRDRLARSIRETDILRRLLKVAEAAEKEFDNQEEEEES